MRVGRLVEQASRIFNLPASEILGPRRHKHLATPRQAICLAACRIGWATTSIGKALGGRDHSTVIHSRDRAWYRIERDEDFREKFNRLFAFAQQAMNAPYEGEAYSLQDEECIRRTEIVARLAGTRSPDEAKPDVAVEHDGDWDMGWRDCDNRREGSVRLIKAIRTEFPERCAA